MEDIICEYFAPVSGQQWRAFACVNRAINARLATKEKMLSTTCSIIKYSNCDVIYTMTKHGVKHGEFTINDTGNCIVEGNYRLGLLHGKLAINSRIKRVIHYSNGKLHGLYEYQSDTQIRHHNYKHGVLHGESRWDTNYKNIGRQVYIANHHDGMVHGTEESWINIGSKKYFEGSRTCFMGKAHGRALYNDIDTTNIDDIKVETYLDVDFDNGKLTNIRISGTNTTNCKWIKKYQRTFVERTRNGVIDQRGDTSENGYADGVIYMNENDPIVSKCIYETRYRIKTGYHMEYQDGNIMHTLSCYRQDISHGQEITFLSSGRISTIKNTVDGYLHGVVKSYYTHGHIIYKNYLFGFDVGYRLVQ